MLDTKFTKILNLVQCDEIFFGGGGWCHFLLDNFDVSESKVEEAKPPFCGKFKSNASNNQETNYI